MNKLHVTDTERPDLGGNVRGGDLHTFCPKLWDVLVDRFAIRSVLDVGCGEGHAVSYFSKLRVIAHGIDGLRQNVARAVYPIALHDLLLSPYVMPVDLVWSCEVAEHILPSKVDNYIQTLANGRVVAMTHGLPGQGGHHHVNLQPQEYWVEKMQAVGFTLDPTGGVFRKIAASEPYMTYFASAGLLFLRG